MPFSSVQSLSRVQLFATPWTAARQASLSITNSWSLLRLMSIELVVPFNHLILCHPLLFPPSIFPSIRVFSSESVLASSGQSIGVSDSASVLPMYIQEWFPLGWTGLFSLHSKGVSRIFSNTIIQKHQFFGAQPSLQSNSHIHAWPLEKPYPWLDGLLLASNVSAFEYTIYVGHNFSSKEQASFNFMVAVSIWSDFGGQEIKSFLFPLFPHLFTMKWWDRMPWSSFSECLVLSQLFHSLLSLSSGGSWVLLHFLQ